jgi:hypothetical protein
MADDPVPLVWRWILFKEWLRRLRIRTRNHHGGPKRRESPVRLILRFQDNETKTNANGGECASWGAVLRVEVEELVVDMIRCAEKVEMINHKRKRWELGNLTEDRVGDDDLAGHRGYFCELNITSHRKIVLST